MKEHTKLEIILAKIGFEMIREMEERRRRIPKCNRREKCENEMREEEPEPEGMYYLRLT